MAKVIEYSIVRAKKSYIAEHYRKLDSNATVYVSERTAKPYSGVWKKVDKVGNDGIYFVKTATLSGASGIWKLVKKADKVIIK